jgi:hypothetical protein
MSALKNIKYFQNLIKLPFLFLVFLRNSAKQKRFLRETIFEAINESKMHNDKSLDKDDYRKIQLYGYAVPAMLGEAYCTLRNKKMTINERMCITFLGPITGLFDDMFDKNELPDLYIKSLIINSKSVIGNNTKEKLFLNLYNKALEISENRESLIDNFLAVFDAQILSRKQKNNGTNSIEIENITFQKGGSSMLMYRSSLNNKINDSENWMIYKLGAIGQLENDIFDIYKDYTEGIKTLATLSDNINQLRQKYLILMTEVYNAVEKTNYQKRAKRKFQRIISLVMSRGLVCLNCLEKNEKKTDGTFKIEKYERNDLICNMESFRSFTKLIHYSAKQIL